MRMSLLICASLVVLMLVGTGCYEVVYTAEYKEGGSCIKFEDAMLYDEAVDDMVEACLGEDGIIQVDGFFVELDGPTDDIEVTVKAGKCKETVTLVEVLPGLWTGVACDFEIYFGDLGEGFEEWNLAVISDDIEGGKDGTAALSNITICFGDGVTVIGPPEGEYEADREDLI